MSMAFQYDLVLHASLGKTLTIAETVPCALLLMLLRHKSHCTPGVIIMIFSWH